ncbi:uncharacterized protein SAPINGB_P005562 [Magnusiomyces paraingens]|uniref:Uncharacterized protein n=1 Tax=Magnusiomyces paraingens TaxID=2606893 RepID=A0A5E8C7H1_9ASCO|nr:uncharacterized protein SAPINGB_P005562 [Saprochaete ingens]VVT57156.1 unnamed protein product [Saprochaete ingens]
MSQTFGQKLNSLLHNKVFMGWFTVTFGGIGIFVASRTYMKGVKQDRFNTLDDTDYVAGAYEGAPSAERKSKYEAGGHSSRATRQHGDILHYGGFFRHTPDKPAASEEASK